MAQIMRPARSTELIQKICEAIGIKPDETARIVIDCQVGEIVWVYVQLVGTHKLVDIDFGGGSLNVVTAVNSNDFVKAINSDDLTRA